MKNGEGDKPVRASDHERIPRADPGVSGPNSNISYNHATSKPVRFIAAHEGAETRSVHLHILTTRSNELQAKAGYNESATVTRMKRSIPITAAPISSQSGEQNVPRMLRSFPVLSWERSEGWM